MEFRSSHVIGYTHHQGDIVSNVGSSHGVHLTQSSLGGVILPASDSAASDLYIAGKGNGVVVLGNSSSYIQVSSGSNISFGSTAYLNGIVRYIDTAVSTPALFNDTDAGRVAETTHTIAGLSSQVYSTPTDYFLFAVSPNLPAAVSICHAYVGSTANQVHVRLAKGSTVAVAATTCTFNFLAIRTTN